MSEDVKAPMTPLSYLKIFFRRKELFVIPAFIGLILGICSGVILPKEYQSSTTLLVREGKSDNPLFDKLAVSTTVEQRISTIRESMLGWNSLIKLVKRLELDKNISTPRELEDLIESIRGDINIKMKGGNIIDLTYVGKDPQTTQAIVKNITAIFIERNLEVQNEETRDAIDFIEKQLKVYRGKIKSAEIAKLRDDLSDLLVDSTDSHPKVQELRNQLKIREEELRKANLEYTEDIELDADTTNPLIGEIRKALDSIDGGSGNATVGLAPAGGETELYKVMLLDKLDNVMARDVGVNNKIYNMLLQRLETAKITERLQGSKEGTKYTILNPPRIPHDPIRPNKILVALVGFALGAMFGFGLVIATEFLDKSFIDVEEAKQFLGRPLLGAISKINTEESVRRERERQAWMYSLTIIAGIVLIIITTAFSNFLN